MKKLLKILGIAAASILVLLGIAIVVATIIVDPNEYRDEITSLVKKQTGRDLIIKGDLSLSFFPWIGLSIGETSLSNAKGFGEKPFAQFNNIQVKVELLPLLGKNIVVDTVVLDGVNINLAKNRSGVSNWDDLVQPGVEQKKSKKGMHDDGAMAGSLSIGGVHIKNANLSWRDDQADVYYQLEQLNLETGALQQGKAIDLELGFNIKDNKAAKTWRVSLSATILMDHSSHSLDVSDMKLQLAGLELNGGIQVKQMDKQPLIQLNLKSDSFVPRELASDFGIALPATSDDTVFGKARFEVTLKADATKLDISKLLLQLDDSSMQGNVSISNFSHPAIRYQIEIDEIDADRYMPPAVKQSKQENTYASAADDRINLPVEMLRSLDVKGVFKIGKLKASNLRSEAVNMDLSAQKGLIRIYPASAKMYGGRYSGDIRLDVRGEQLIVSMNETLSAIQSSPLFKDLMDLDWIEGTANLSAKLTGKGNSVGAIKQQLNGNLEFKFLDGSIKGVNIPLKIRQAYNAIKGLPAPPDEAQKTDFTAMTGTATVSNGVVNNSDLNIQSPILRIQGAGNADLVKENINYLIKAKVVASLAGQGGDSLAKLKGVTIPVRIKGPFTKLSYKVELDDILKQELKKKLKNKLKERFKDLF